MSREKDIQYALDRIGFNGNLLDFIKVHKEFYSKVEKKGTTKSAFLKIIYTHILYEIHNNKFVKKRKFKPKRINKLLGL